MKWWIGLAIVIDARWVTNEVPGGIPARTGQIEATDEGNGVVDNDDLLVMRGTDRMVRIHEEMQPAVRRPSQLD